MYHLLLLTDTSVDYLKMYAPVYELKAGHAWQFSKAEEAEMTEGQLYAYERFWQAVVNERVLIEGGYKKGRAEGRAEGREEGRIEERLKNARNLKANGIPLDVIASSLGLSQDEIEAL